VISVEKFQALKKKAQDDKTEFDRAEGALEQKMEKLKKDHGCSTTAEAEAYIAKLQKEELEIETQYNAEFDKYEAKWGKV
jgi:hypothetical protein